MARWEPEQQVRLPVARQAWRDLTFLHLAYPPEVVARLLPAGLEPDLFDGRAWVGTTPFTMRASVLPLLPGPRVTVGEVNVRTYVRDRHGRDGLWFLTLELDHLAVAAALRTLLRLPYHWSRVSTRVDDGLVRYRSRRRWARDPAALALDIEVGDPLVPEVVGAFETFLVGRWRAFTTVHGRVLAVPVDHPPWPLHQCTVTRLRQDLLEAVGLPPPVGEPHVLFSPGVEARVGAVRLR